MNLVKSSLRKAKVYIYTTDELKWQAIKTASKMFSRVQSCNLRLVNMSSILFNVIPNSEFAKFYIFEKKKAAKGGFFYDFMSGK